MFLVLNIFINLLWVNLFLIFRILIGKSDLCCNNVVFVFLFIIMFFIWGVVKSYCLCFFKWLDWIINLLLIVCLLVKLISIFLCELEVIMVFMFEWVVILVVIILVFILLVLSFVEFLFVIWWILGVIFLIIESKVVFGFLCGLVVNKFFWLVNK